MPDRCWCSLCSILELLSIFSRLCWWQTEFNLLFRYRVFNKISASDFDRKYIRRSTISSALLSKIFVLSQPTFICPVNIFLKSIWFRLEIYWSFSHFFCRALVALCTLMCFFEMFFQSNCYFIEKPVYVWTDQTTRSVLWMAKKMPAGNASRLWKSFSTLQSLQPISNSPIIATNLQLLQPTKNA